MYTSTTFSIFVCLLLAIQFSFQSSPFYSKSTRNIRVRNNYNKRPQNPDLYSVNKQLVLSTDGWKPIYSTNGVLRKHHKYSSFSSKFPSNILFTTEFYPKTTKPSPSTSFVTNFSQSIQSFEESSTQGAPKGKKPQQRKPSQQYEVYENVNEEPNQYDPSQNRFRYQEIPVAKPVGKPVKKSAMRLEASSGKHFHYARGNEPVPSRYTGRTTNRNNRLNSTSRKPYS